MARPILNDVVRMSTAWVRSTQAHEVGDMIGEVVNVSTNMSPQVVQVRWDGGPSTWSVLAKNLEILDRPGPDTCSCGDQEWGACPKDTCWQQYDEERNGV